MQAGSVDFVSNVLPLTTHSYSPISTEQMPLDSTSFYKTNTTASSSSGYESVLSHSSKSHRSFFSRLKRLINFPSTKKSSDYQISTLNNANERKSARRALPPATQHIPFLYGLKNCGNTW
jgi:hypothetical protein